MSAETYRERLGDLLRARRKLLRLTQTEVAELAGTTQRSVSQVETGKASSLDLYASICDVVGLELTAVPRQRGGSQPPPPS
jgi:HTH-type transcriptional regulator / antitoxin HipB